MATEFYKQFNFGFGRIRQTIFTVGADGAMGSILVILAVQPDAMVSMEL
jgi:hypothetical protein